MSLVLVLGLASLLPIWKVPGQEGGYSFWDMVYGFQRGVEHIPVEQAKREAYYLWYQDNNNAEQS